MLHQVALAPSPQTHSVRGGIYEAADAEAQDTLHMSWSTAVLKQICLGLMESA